MASSKADAMEITEARAMLGWTRERSFSLGAAG
jgi:hypothetical protein